MSSTLAQALGSLLLDTYLLGPRFHLAQLYIHSFDDKLTIEDVWTELLRLHRQEKMLEADAVRQAFDNTIMRISNRTPKDRGFALATLTFVAYAERPIRTSELQDLLTAADEDQSAIGTQRPSIEDISFACGGLVALDAKSGLARCVHPTIQHCLAATMPTLLPDAERYFAEACIRCLTFAASQRSSSTRQDLDDQGSLAPFLAYAAANWGHHARKASGDAITKSVIDFLAHGPNLEPRKKALRSFGKRAPETGLDLAAYFGLEAVVRELIRMSPADASLGSPLVWGAKGGHEEGVAPFLRPEVEPKPRDIDCQHALKRATELGHSNIVKLLLASGLDPNSPLGSDNTFLGIAVERDHRKVVEVLLQKGADVRKGLLVDAAKWGSEAAMRAMLHFKVDANSIGGLYSSFYQNERNETSFRQKGVRATALMCLVDSVVEAKPPTCEEERENKPRFIRIALLLLAHGANPNLVGEKGQVSPLLHATRGSCLGLVKLLLRSGANPNQRDTKKRTPLHMAAKAGCLAIVDALLAIPSTKLDLRDSAGRTPLLVAAEAKHLNVVMMLLEKLGTPDFGGQNVLSKVVDREVDCVARLVQDNLDHKKDVNYQTLFWSIRRGHLHVTKLFRISPWCQNHDDKALRLAAVHGQLPALEFLVMKCGLDVNHDNSGNSVIYSAIRSKQLAMVDFLMQNGASPDRYDDDLEITPLSEAVEKGHEPMVRLLLEKYQADPDRGTPLHKATTLKLASIMKLLILKGSIVNSTGEEDWLDLDTPLHLAAAAGFEEGFALLCAHGAELDSPSILAHEHRCLTLLDLATRQLSSSSLAKGPMSILKTILKEPRCLTLLKLAMRQLSGSSSAKGPISILKTITKEPRYLMRPKRETGRVLSRCSSTPGRVWIYKTNVDSHR